MSTKKGGRSKSRTRIKKKRVSRSSKMIKRVGGSKNKNSSGESDRIKRIRYQIIDHIEDNRFMISRLAALAAFQRIAEGDDRLVKTMREIYRSNINTSLSNKIKNKMKDDGYDSDIILFYQTLLREAMEDFDKQLAKGASPVLRSKAETWKRNTTSDLEALLTRSLYPGSNSKFNETVQVLHMQSTQFGKAFSDLRNDINEYIQIGRTCVMSIRVKYKKSFIGKSDEVKQAIIVEKNLQRLDKEYNMLLKQEINQKTYNDLLNFKKRVKDVVSYIRSLCPELENKLAKNKNQKK